MYAALTAFRLYPARTPAARTERTPRADPLIPGRAPRPSRDGRAADGGRHLCGGGHRPLPPVGTAVAPAPTNPSAWCSVWAPRLEYSSGNSGLPASAWSSFLVVKPNGAGKRTMVKQFNYVHFVTNVGGWHRPHLPPWPPPQRCRCRSAGAGAGGIPNPLAAVILGWPLGHGAGGSTDGSTTVAENNWGAGWDGSGGVSDGSRGSGGRARGGCAPREATRHATAGLRPPDCRCPGG